MDTETNQAPPEETPKDIAPVEGREATEGDQAAPAGTESDEAKAKGKEGQAEGEKAQDEDEETDESEETSKPDGKHRRKTGYQRRLERLERQLEEKDAIIHRVLSTQQAPPPPAADAPKPDPTQQAQQYVQNMVREGVRQELAQRDQATQTAQLEQKWQEQIAADEENGYEKQKLLNTVRQQLAPGPIKEALLTSEYAPALISSLFGNPRELARFSALSEGQAAREIGRLEAQLAAGATPAKPPPKSAVPRPPAPPTSVGGSAASTRSLDDLPLSEYKKAYRSGRR